MDLRYLGTINCSKYTKKNQKDAAVAVVLFTNRTCNNS